MILTFSAFGSATGRCYYVTRLLVHGGFVPTWNWVEQSQGTLYRFVNANDPAFAEEWAARKMR